jgi:hypothetical protein
VRYLADVSESSLALTLNVSAVFCFLSFFTVGLSIAAGSRRQNLYCNRIAVMVGRNVSSTQGNLRVVLSGAFVPFFAIPFYFFINHTHKYKFHSLSLPNSSSKTKPTISFQTQRPTEHLISNQRQKEIWCFKLRLNHKLYVKLHADKLNVGDLFLRVLCPYGYNSHFCMYSSTSVFIPGQSMYNCNL